MLVQQPPNCTLVELKFEIPIRDATTLASPNCTLVELKLRRQATPLQGRLTSKLYLSGIEMWPR